MLGLAMGLGMALHTGFLHWRTARPARVLYIDGEMPRDLLQQRIRDAVRRAGLCDGRMIDNLMVYSVDDAERLAELYPTLGRLDPLNTDPGQQVMHVLCTALRPDVVILDNVQSLLAGVMKEEESWLPTLELVQWLSRQQIGQLWLDHTGHNTERQYGTATKSWRFDTVGLMTPLADEDRAPYETAFTLSFDPPGKARRRTPDNWAEFEPHIIRLRDDVWTSEPVGSKAKVGAVKPSRRVFHTALLDAIAHAPVRPGETTQAAWEAECVRRDLIVRPDPEDEWQVNPSFATGGPNRR